MICCKSRVVACLIVILCSCHFSPNAPHSRVSHACSFLTLSCLQSFQIQDLSRPLIAEILCRVHGLLSVIVFMWVSSHVGPPGNSAAFIATKAAQILQVSYLAVLYSDYMSLILASRA